MNLNDYFLIGKIGKAKSFKGEVFLRISEEEIFHELEEIESLVVNIKDRLIKYPIEKLEFKNNKTAVVKFKGIDDSIVTERIKNCEVYIPKELLPESDGEEAFTHEYIGCRVMDETKGELGEINYIDKSSAQYLAYLEIEGKEVVFPLIPEFIVELDLQNKILRTDLPEGILEIND